MFLKDTILEAGTAKTEADPSFNVNVTYFSDSVEWQQKLDLAGIDTAIISGTVAYFVKSGEEYNNYEEPFKTTIIKAGKKQPLMKQVEKVL